MFCLSDRARINIASGVFIAAAAAAAEWNSACLLVLDKVDNISSDNIWWSHERAVGWVRGDDDWLRFCLAVLPETKKTKKKTTHNHKTNTARISLCLWRLITPSRSLFSLFFFSPSCGAKAKTDEESNNRGRGKQAHSKVWGNREPSPHLQMVQRWQRAEEKQKSQNKEQPVSTSHPCPAKRSEL